MKIALLSDIHLGDSLSALAYRERDGQIVVGEGAYKKLLNVLQAEFAHTAPILDYLVLVGDILDFSVVSYQEAYAVAQVFFQRLKDDGITREIIYLPGNHDFALWHSIEHQVNVINRINKNHLPNGFRMSVPGILDLRSNNPDKRLLLPGISEQKCGAQRYAGLFLDQITAPASIFNFVYPNLYIFTDKESFLVTHGEYLESYWSFFGKALNRYAGKEMGLGENIDIHEFVSLNFPFTQLASSGVGQAGEFSKWLQKLLHEIREKNFKGVQIYWHRIWSDLVAMIKSNYGRLLGSIIGWLVGPFCKKYLLKTLTQMDTARFRDNFVNNPTVREKFIAYWQSSQNELTEIMAGEKKILDRIIFAHTHDPIPRKGEKALELEGSFGKQKIPLIVFNTGSWVYRNEEAKKENRVEANLFLFHPEKGFQTHLL